MFDMYEVLYCNFFFLFCISSELEVNLLRELMTIIWNMPTVSQSVQSLSRV